MPPVFTTRPLTDEERTLLREPRPRLFGWTGLVSALCVLALAFLVVLLASRWLPPAAILPIATGAGVLAAAGVYVSVQRRARRRLQELDDLVSQELARGYVNCTTFTITDAVAVEEQEDEGVSYHLLLDDGRALFLSGQYLYRPVEAGFPWAVFEVVRVPVGGWVLRLVSHGPSLTPSHTRRPFSDAERDSGAVPADGTISQRDFEALKNA